MAIFSAILQAKTYTAQTDFDQFNYLLQAESCILQLPPSSSLQAARA